MKSINIISIKENMLQISDITKELNNKFAGKPIKPTTKTEINEFIVTYVHTWANQYNEISNECEQDILRLIQNSVNIQ